MDFVVKASPIHGLGCFATAALICDTGGDLWGEHPKYSKGDWRYEIDNNDTVLGYWEWVYMKLEGEESES